jgi:hypothetical protein
MKILLTIVLVQSLNLIVFTWFNRSAWVSRSQTAAQHLQEKGEKASVEKQGSAVLVVALKDLGRLGI